MKLLNYNKKIKIINWKMKDYRKNNQKIKNFKKINNIKKINQTMKFNKCKKTFKIINNK